MAFRELGASGFGLNRVRVQLARVDSIGADGTAAAVYEASTNLVRPAPPTVLEVAAGRALTPTLSQGARGEEENSAATSLTLDFLTPTTLKSGSTVDRDGTMVRRPAFHHILKRLRDRVNALATFYGPGPLDLDFKALGEAAEKVETVDDQTHWVERSRFSRRRDVSHDLSGFAGRVSLRGELAPFLACCVWVSMCTLARMRCSGMGGL